MKIIKTLAMLSLVAILVTAASAQKKQAPPPSQPNNGAAPSGPALAIESLTHDFGEVKAGTPLRFAFKVKNEGKADLLILNVAPG